MDCSPRKTVQYTRYLGRGRRRVAPLFLIMGGPNGPTAREQIGYYLVLMDTTEDGCGRHCCALACVTYTVRTDSAGEAQDLAWAPTLKRVFLRRHGTDDHEQLLSVPLVPMLFGGSS